MKSLALIEIVCWIVVNISPVFCFQNIVSCWCIIATKNEWYANKDVGTMKKIKVWKEGSLQNGVGESRIGGKRATASHGTRPSKWARGCKSIPERSAPNCAPMLDCGNPFSCLWPNVPPGYVTAAPIHWHKLLGRHCVYIRIQHQC